MKTTDHINDLLDKGEQIKELKKRNDELVEVLKEAMTKIRFPKDNILRQDFKKRAEQALKNNEND